MTAPSPNRTAELIDLAGRIMLTHAIDPRHLMNLLGVDKLDAEEMIRTGETSVVPGDDWHDRLQLFVNILVRLECRLRHDSRAIRGLWKVGSTHFTVAQRPMDLGVAWTIFGWFAMPWRRWHWCRKNGGEWVTKGCFNGGTAWPL